MFEKHAIWEVALNFLRYFFRFSFKDSIYFEFIFREQKEGKPDKKSQPLEESI